MGCCGGRKVRNPAPVPEALNAQQVAEAGEVLLEYTGEKAAPITVAGPATGKNYRFSKFDRIQAVKEPDVSGLIAVGAFRRT